MKKKIFTIVDDIALAKLQVNSPSDGPEFTHMDWIRLVRIYLRMTQAELAKRANITQANLIAIESGKADPRVSTLRRIYQGLCCNLDVAPHPEKPLKEILHGRARALASQRLKITMGTMALGEQAPDVEFVARLLEKRTDDILGDPRERLWRKNDNE
ncbi:MAG: helix-turn-helix domain-containing protein [Nitrospirales bacterium]